MLSCSMTSQRKDYPFEVVIEVDTDRESVVLAGRVNSLDWKVRKVVKKGTGAIDVIAETLSELQTLLWTRVLTADHHRRGMGEKPSCLREEAFADVDTDLGSAEPIGIAPQQPFRECSVLVTERTVMRKSADSLTITPELTLILQTPTSKYVSDHGRSEQT